jgi:hypothetical protein
MSRDSASLSHDKKRGGHFMKHLTAILLIIGLIITEAQGGEVNWHLLTKSKNNPDEVVYIDLNSISLEGKTDSMEWKYWLKFTNPDLKIKSKEIDEYVTFRETNCKKGMSRILTNIFYFKEKVVYSENPVTGNAGEWKYIVPGTLGDKLYKLLCEPVAEEKSNSTGASPD